MCAYVHVCVHGRPILGSSGDWLQAEATEHMKERRKSKKRYPLVNIQKTMENHHANKMGTSTISTGPFSIAMLNYQRVSPAYK